MVSVEKISRKCIRLDEYLDILSEIAKTPGEIFLKDKILEKKLQGFSHRRRRRCEKRQV